MGTREQPVTTLAPDWESVPALIPSGNVGPREEHSTLLRLQGKLCSHPFPVLSMGREQLQAAFLLIVPAVPIVPTDIRFPHVLAGLLMGNPFAFQALGVDNI